MQICMICILSRSHYVIAFYSLLKFVYVTSQLRHSLVVHPLLRKILDSAPVTMLCTVLLQVSRPCFRICFGVTYAASATD